MTNAQRASLVAHGIDELPSIKKDDTVKVFRDKDKVQLNVTEGETTRFMRLNRKQSEALASALFLEILTWEENSK